MTFGSLYKVFLQDAKATDEWYVHDDYLETRLTFGLLGAAGIYTSLGLVVIRIGCLGGVPLPGILVACLVLGLLGSLVHARLDWVFQTHPILFLGTLCAPFFRSARFAERVGSGGRCQVGVGG